MKPGDGEARTFSASGHLPPSDAGRDDPRVAAALEEYLTQLKAGRNPSRQEFLARYADIADSLSECLDGLIFVHSAARDVPGTDPDPSAPEPLLPSRILGDYQIVREIGRGGMGVVYEAEQVSLGRRVALKVQPLVASLDERQLQRFELEAQIAAHLHHPHIVPVFAVGSDRGIHYYAMQLIDGRPLSVLIRNLRQSAEGAASPSQGAPSAVSETSGPSAETSSGSDSTRRDRAYFRTAASLGKQAAEALEHAHDLGVLHRDIKPSNLIVDALGDLWVTDFGLARFEEDEGLTRTGDVLGTLRYMSPEQASGRHVLVDARTDIYSLGATLYELVTLRPAFDGRDRQELLNQITLLEPTPPRRINPSIPRDLETIILKAMAKEVGGRYGSAREMADDLGRFLQDRPIRARRPTPFDLAAKWSRRHRTALAAALGALLLALTIGSVLLWLERQRTLAALAALYQARKDERAALRLIFMSSDDITIESMAHLAASAPDKGSKEGGYYRKALSYYEDMSKRFENDPEMRMIAAESYRRVGFIRMILRFYHKEKDYQQADAEGAYRRAITLCDKIPARSTDSLQSRRLKATILQELGQMLMAAGNIAAGEADFREAITLRRKLAAEVPGNRQFADDLKESLQIWNLMFGGSKPPP